MSTLVNINDCRFANSIATSSSRCCIILGTIVQLLLRFELVEEMVIHGASCFCPWFELALRFLLSKSVLARYLYAHIDKDIQRCIGWQWLWRSRRSSTARLLGLAVAFYALPGPDDDSWSKKRHRVRVLSIAFVPRSFEHPI